MNYDEARQLPEGGWHWTTMNDGVIRTAPPCISFKKPLDPAKPFEPVAPEDVVRCDPHETKEGAELHFYHYCLNSLKETEWTTARLCDAGCETWTNKSLSNLGMGGYFPEVFLCDFHRHPRQVGELHPFQGGIQLVHS